MPNWYQHAGTVLDMVKKPVLVAWLPGKAGLLFLCSLVLSFALEKLQEF